MKTPINRRSFLGSLAAATPFVAHGIARAAEGNPKPPSGTVNDVKDVLTPLLEEHSLPGLAAGALKNGVMVVLGAVGVRKVGTTAAVTIGDKFHLGSDTKAMTATLIAMLVEEGRLQWDRTLAQVFPERTTRMHASYRSVTVEMLLTHRSGADHDGTDYGPPRVPVTEQRLACMDSVITKAPKHDPGEYSYSNAGYIIAGAILERITGHSWEAFIQQKLFKPLGMTSAGFGPAAKSGQTDQPWGHVWKNGVFEPRNGDNPPALGPAGTVHCSLTDYLKFAGLHSTKGSRPPGLLQPQFFTKLQVAAKGNYAMGWGTGQRPWAKGRILSHDGSNTMNYFSAWIAPNIDLCMAVACNAAGKEVPQATNKVVEKLVELYAD